MGRWSDSTPSTNGPVSSASIRWMATFLSRAHACLLFHSDIVVDLVEHTAQPLPLFGCRLLLKGTLKSGVCLHLTLSRRRYLRVQSLGRRHRTANVYSRHENPTAEKKGANTFRREAPSSNSADTKMCQQRVPWCVRLG